MEGTKVGGVLGLFKHESEDLVVGGVIPGLRFPISCASH